ncbi:acyltransferase family protein [Flavobacterium sp.]|uniref:acyltransferase family protein n=1 Tax=Flavobacterium sp. TaxID=239 RepID=UPI003BC85697
MSERLNYINSIRGIAILGVIMVHTSQFGNFAVPKIVASVISNGARGVQLFYLASAFTLFLSFKNRFSKEKFPIRNFFLRRFFRIAPMYYLGICYFIFQDGLGPRNWLGDQNHITYFNIISNFTFLHGFYPYWINSLVPGGWSIGVEMMFYACLPLLFLNVKSINQAFNLFIISIFIKAVLHLFFRKFQLISDDNLWNQYLFLYFPSQFPVFCLGIFLYFSVIEKESLKNISGKSIFILSILLIINFSIGTEFLFQNHIIFGILFTIFTVALSKFQFILFVNRFMNYIGEISFSMYLVHFAVLYWCAKLNFIDYVNDGIINYMIRFSIITSFTILISSILYRTIEIPFQDLGKRLILRQEKSTKI